MLPSDEDGQPIQNRIFLLTISEECSIPQTPSRTAILNDMLMTTVSLINEQENQVDHKPCSDLMVGDMIPYESLVQDSTCSAGADSNKKGIASSWVTTLQKVLCSFHAADYVSFVKRRSEALADAAQNHNIPIKKIHRFEVQMQPTIVSRTSQALSAAAEYDSDSDDAEFGFADLREVPDSEASSSTSNDDQSPNGINKMEMVHSSGYISHSSCPPFPFMWRSAVQNVLGTLTALRALLPIRKGNENTSPLDDDTEPTPLIDWLALVAPTSGAQLATPVNIAMFPAGGRHHAKRDRADGFCIFNDIVLAVLAIQKYSASVKERARILVVDIDAHHGDGTEEAFAFDKSVTTLSIHCHGVGMYPGTGAPKPSSNTINIPINAETSSDAIVNHLNEALQQLFIPTDESAKNMAPSPPFSHIILVAGTDALHGDPNGGGLRLSIGGFRKMVGKVMTLSQEHTIPLLVLGAGGYVDTATSICWSHIVSDAYYGHSGDEKPFLTEVPDTLEFFDLYSKHNFLMI